MKLLIAPDSFKGSAKSEHIIELVKNTAKKCFEDCEIIAVPMADGGEGTLDVLVQFLGGNYESCEVSGPLGEKHIARYGIINENTVVIESAEISGLTLVKEENRNPFKASSKGIGEMICHVLRKGYTNIILALGGSATNDGGVGAASALGINFLDKDKNDLLPNGENLINIKKIDIKNLMPELKKAKITIICDVQNPLVGISGATYIYGPQKGATQHQLEVLEKGMNNYVDVIKEEFGMNVGDIPGIGAAGGLSVPFLVFGNAKIESGIQTILKIIRFEELLNKVDLVITGEGKVDGQSICGKVICGIGEVCRKKGVPVAAIVGGMGEDAERVFEHGIVSVITTVNGVMSLDTAVSECDRLIISAADRMFRFIKMGMDLQAGKEKKEVVCCE